ncbi:hypothetical protein CsSME_00043184 [Camellia sinensis var. sinensis]
MMNTEVWSIECYPHEELRVSIVVFFNSSNRHRLDEPLPEPVSPEKSSFSTIYNIRLHAKVLQ